MQDADAIWREEIANAGLDKEINQYFAVLTNMHSVGVMGDERTYDYAVALRAVTTTDFMTAENDMPWDVLGTSPAASLTKLSVNRVFYDCTGKAACNYRVGMTLETLKNPHEYRLFARP